MDKERLIQKYLDGELTGEQEREALHVIADDPEMRSLLSFEKKTLQAFSGSEEGTTEVPENFSLSVMEQIEKKEDASGEGILSFIKEWLQSLWTPKVFRLRPVTAAAFATILLAIVVAPFFFSKTDQQLQNVVIPGQDSQQDTFSEASVMQNEEVWVRFVYIDKEAESISVAGDFNDWEPESLSQQTVNGQQVWTGLVSMSRGEHSYMFLKNGEQWLTDPMAPVHRNDGFGNKNAVIYL